MTRDEVRTELFRAIHKIAPEADLEHVDPDIEFRDQVDIDSFDFLNIVIALNESLGVDIPEADYGKVTTMGGMLTYLEAAVAGGA